METLNEKLEETMTSHDDCLTSIGTVTYVEKPELIYFNRKKQMGSPLVIALKAKLL